MHFVCVYYGLYCNKWLYEYYIFWTVYKSKYTLINFWLNSNIYYSYMDDQSYAPIYAPICIHTCIIIIIVINVI